MIECIVSDSIIWNKDKFIIDLFAAKDQGPVDIDLKHEGPCCEQVGLNEILSAIPGLNVRAIHTSNQIQSSDFNEVRKSFVELALAKQKAKAVSPTVSDLTKRFALFVGRSNWQRLGLASFLWKKYNNLTKLTYHYNRLSEYHLPNLGLELLLEKQWEHRQLVYEFLDQLPITHDYQTYPILWNENAFDLDDQYAQIFCEIVCETFFSGKTFMITEKTLRPIIQRRPFVIQGPKFYLENLKKIGFKTFDAWWPEDYDLDGPDGQTQSIRSTIDYIGNQSPETIKKWYEQMQPTLDHNLQVLLNLTDAKILSTKFKSDQQ